MGNVRLTVPEPAYRHGEPLTFGGLEVLDENTAPGAVRKPSASVDSEAIRDLAFSLIRVIDDDGAAVGPWAGTLRLDDLLAGLHDMLLVRAFDARMLRSQRQGKTSFYMQSLGEEAISCAFRKAL